MQLFQELQQWGQKVAHGHTAKREIIQNLARSYNENLLDFGESVKEGTRLRMLARLRYSMSE
jgi:hypothetical protein